MIMVNWYSYLIIICIVTSVFINMYGLPSVEEDVKISLPNDENLSSITLKMSCVESRYIVELVNDKRDQIFRRFTIDNDCDLHCPYLKTGNYAIRIMQDRNRNGIFDMGNLLERRQPETVRIFIFDNGTDYLTLPERTDVEQEINIVEMFR